MSREKLFEGVVIEYNEKQKDGSSIPAYGSRDMFLRDCHRNTVTITFDLEDREITAKIHMTDRFVLVDRLRELVPESVDVLGCSSGHVVRFLAERD